MQEVSIAIYRTIKKNERKTKSRDQDSQKMIHRYEKIRQEVVATGAKIVTRSLGYAIIIQKGFAQWIHDIYEADKIELQPPAVIRDPIEKTSCSQLAILFTNMLFSLAERTNGSC